MHPELAKGLEAMKALSGKATIQMCGTVVSEAELAEFKKALMEMYCGDRWLALLAMMVTNMNLTLRIDGLEKEASAFKGALLGVLLRLAQLEAPL